MQTHFNEPLFVFEMANNHMGSVDHGLDMIHAFGDIADRFPFRFALKFQFRNFATFIHPDYQMRMDLKYVKRFSETKLTKDQFQRLKDAADARKFISMCTPFDEPSVDLAEQMGFDMLKVASCSFTDWPLLERLGRVDKPLIASTAGATIEDIDKVVSFFRHRGKQFAIMHCVGEYPTTADHLQLNQIDLFKQRYQDVPIGFSTHEEPSNVASVQVAIAKGAVIFERHIAIDTPEFKKNDYSATPEQTDLWLQSAAQAFQMCGIVGRRSVATQKELADLRQFKRGGLPLAGLRRENR